MASEIPTVKVGDRLKSYFKDKNAANEFANKVNGTVYPVDFFGGYEVFYSPTQDNIEVEENEIEME